MKKISIMLLLLVSGSFIFQSCEDQDDNSVVVSDFIWKGLNLYYLWQEDVPNLSDDINKTQDQLNTFLLPFANRADLFEGLLYQRGVVDKWSILYSDYQQLENALQGVSKTSGMEFGLVYTGVGQNVFGYVRYVQPGSDAELKGVQRGDIFYAVNGTTLTDVNYSELLYGQDNYTINMADYTGSTFVPNGESFNLTKTELPENPILVANTYQSGSRKIGYLMYNGFYSAYNVKLNDEFGKFASEGVTDLVLDLRYNGGGSVQTATYLASMITGQFNGQVFAHEQWNSKLNAYFKDRNAAVLDDNFTDNMNGTAINSLNLNKVYILTSGTTASASELVINCLEPYIDVTVIGIPTTGKNVGSVTLYDSPDFSRRSRSSDHRYAMQPIVFKVVNKNGEGDYTEGIDPDVTLEETLNNLGQLGDPAEPLYAKAIQLITANGRSSNSFGTKYKHFGDSKSLRRMGNEMYTEKLPEVTP